MSIRLRLKHLCISKLDMGNNQMTLTFLEGRVRNRDHLVKLATERSKRFRFLPNNNLNIYVGSLVLPKDFKRIEQILDQLNP